MPSALAVLRLITSSNLFDNSKGNAPGLAPLRILSDVPRRPAIDVGDVGSVTHEEPCLRKSLVKTNRFARDMARVLLIQGERPCMAA
jgi:hypothetical protein